MSKETITISAKGRPLGRLATEVALLLRGKNKPDFALNKPGDCVVVIENIKEVKITGRKFKEKTYTSHTGWPGGFKRVTMEQIASKKGLEEILRMAVSGMLPKNRLRKDHLKRLTFKN